MPNDICASFCDFCVHDHAIASLNTPYVVVLSCGYLRRTAMTSVLSSLFTRDPKAHFAYDLPQTSFHTSKGISMGRSFKKNPNFEHLSSSNVKIFKELIWNSQQTVSAEKSPRRRFGEAKNAEPTEKATCFFATLDQYGGGANLKQQAQKLKTMRHPNVLTYLDSIECWSMKTS
uniref:Protein kinase domain-containing protein n=1 Tax=Parascaris equorum TaxID=6256 RepID=A0A914RMD7_PAREQ